VALAWGLLHGIIVPRIDEFRPRLEAEASRLVGMPVRIGHLSAESKGLVPLFEAQEVVLQDAEGRPAIRLPKVTVALSPASVWRRGFTQLVVDGLELDVRREADGRILVGGKVVDQGAADTTSDSPALDWLFEQTEVVVRQGTLRWTDAQRNAPTVALTDIHLLLRNRGRSHLMRLDATPPPEWGQRMSLVGRLRQPLLALHNGRWREWDGALYADFPRLDTQQLHLYSNLSSGVAAGQGAFRLWADVQQGQLAAVTADVALAHVNVRLDSNLEPLELPSLQGRLGWRQVQNAQGSADGFEFSTEGMRFTAADGLVWPGGNVFVRSTTGAGNTPEGQFRGDQLDLATLAQIAKRLPLSDALHDNLARLAPKGRLENIDVRWQGNTETLVGYAAKGRVTGLDVAPEALSAAAVAEGHVGHPGIRGATVDFDLSQAGGKAALALQNGSMTFPGVFEEPEVPFDSFASDVSWKIDGQKWAVTVGRTQFANADAAGNLTAKWSTSDPARSAGKSRFPGVLELDGVLDRGAGPRVHRYLPLGVNADARHYVRNAVTGGGATNIRFRVRGDLHDFPYTDPRRGEFHISADVKDATFAFVPQSINPAGRPPWPVLTRLSGNLIFDRNGMQVKGASGRLGPNGANGANGTNGASGTIAVPKVEADIADFHHSVVRVTADANGRLNDMLGIVRSSPLNAITQRSLESISATGNGQLQLSLTLPIADIDNSKVQGSVTLAGSDVVLMPGVPILARTKGVVAFSETGLSITGGQARLLGGDVSFEGGSPTVRPLASVAAKPASATSAVAANANDPSMSFRINGTATADGLRQAREVEGLAAIANQMSGSTTYAAQLAIRRGAAEITLTSSLQGMALRLPAPLNKAADTTLPLRVERVLLPPTGTAAAPGPERDRITASLGKVVSAQYVRDVSGSAPRVLRGAVALGDRADGVLPLPDSGVAAQIALDALDTDVWESAFAPVAAPASVAASTPVATPAPAAVAPPFGAMADYVPTRISVRTKTLTFSGRALHDVSLDATHNGQVWRANINAAEVSGNGEYRPSSDSSPGRLYARLAKLHLGSTGPGTGANTGPTETALENATRSVPALDVVVEDFQLQGNKLGRLELEAVNRAASVVQRDAANNNEWRLNRLVLSNPEATFTASGNWSALNAQPGARRTVLNFKLDVADGGKLLERFEMPGVFRKGKGRMDGQIAWVGAPTALDYPSLVGQLNVNLEDGQFLKADPGLAKLLGVLSLQALPRRLTLDFSDIFSAGFTFDFIRGDVKIDRGIAATNNLQMKGVNAAVLMDGKVDLAKETQDLKVVVIPEISAGTAALAATVINPAIGIGAFLAQAFLRKPLMEAATQVFHIDGAWADPKITKVNRKSLWSGDPGAEPQDAAKDNSKDSNPDANRNGANR
jgi:uncharacterized protein (TIGR02099 family)